jgi:hypothetical protein
MPDKSNKLSFFFGATSLSCYEQKSSTFSIDIVFVVILLWIAIERSFFWLYHLGF